MVVGVGSLTVVVDAGKFLVVGGETGGEGKDDVKRETRRREGRRRQFGDWDRLGLLDSRPTWGTGDWQDLRRQRQVPARLARSTRPSQRALFWLGSWRHPAGGLTGSGGAVIHRRHPQCHSAGQAISRTQCQGERDGKKRLELSHCTVGQRATSGKGQASQACQGIGGRSFMWLLGAPFSLAMSNCHPKMSECRLAFQTNKIC